MRQCLAQNWAAEQAREAAACWPGHERASQGAVLCPSGFSPLYRRGHCPPQHLDFPDLSVFGLQQVMEPGGNQHSEERPSHTQLMYLLPSPSQNPPLLVPTLYLLANLSLLNDLLPPR